MGLVPNSSHYEKPSLPESHSPPGKKLHADRHVVKGGPKGFGVPRGGDDVSNRYA